MELFIPFLLSITIIIIIIIWKTDINWDYVLTKYVSTNHAAASISGNPKKSKNTY